MGWQTILALALVVPIVLIPVVLVWYINLGGIYTAMKEARAARAAQKTAVGGELATAKQDVSK